MKRGAFLVGFFVLSILFFNIGFVSADLADDTQNVIKGAFTGIAEGLEEVLGPYFSDSESLTKIFFFILVVMVIYSISETFNSKKWINMGISVIVSILAVFFLPSELITSLRSSYGALGAAILSIIPFIIVLVFSVRHKSVGIAKASWLIFAIYYFALLIYEWVNQGWRAENIFYIAGILVGIAFIFAMKPLRELFWKGELAGLEEEADKVVSRGGLLHKIQKKELKGYTDGAGI